MQINPRPIQMIKEALLVGRMGWDGMVIIGPLIITNQSGWWQQETVNKWEGIFIVEQKSTPLLQRWDTL